MPFCPSCKYEYRPEITECPDCGAELVDELPAEPEQTGEPVELVRIASYPYEAYAQQVRLLLEAEGITAVIANEKIFQTDAILAWADGGVHVMVPKEEAARASEILEEDRNG